MHLGRSFRSRFTAVHEWCTSPFCNKSAASALCKRSVAQRNICCALMYFSNHVVWTDHILLQSSACSPVTPKYLAGDSTAIHVQSSEGEALSVLDNAEALDSIIAQCNRKGLRERALQTALQKDQAQLGESLQADLPRLVVSAHSGAAETASTNGADKRTIQVSCRSTFFL